MSDYSDSGFDSFLSRSIDDLSQSGLDSKGPLSTQTRFDTGQASGPFGDVMRLKNIVIDGGKGTISMMSDRDSAGIVLDGPNRRITVYDENNDRIFVGNIGR